MTLISTYKPIALELPEALDASIEAKTKYGEIKIDLPQHQMTTQGKNHINFDVGTGKIPVFVETDKNITIVEKK